MPSAQTVTQNPHRRQTLPKTASRASRGLILVGIVLLIMALLMFLYVKGYRPPEKMYEKRIEQTLQTTLLESPPHSLTFSSRSLSSQESRRSVGKLESISAHRIFNHPRRDNHQRASSFSLTQPQSQKITSEPLQGATTPLQDSSSAQQTPDPTQERINKQEKPNIVRRFFRWFTGLFRGKKQSSKLSNRPPVISAVKLSETNLVLAPDCSQSALPASNCASTGNQVQVRVEARDADGDELRYKPIAKVGKFSIDKGNITWDLTGVSPGTHTLQVAAFDGQAESGFYPASINVRQCDCAAKSPCPYQVNISAPADLVLNGDIATFSADVAYSGSSALNYTWTISAGTIISGAGTPTITVDTTGMAGQDVTVSLTVDDGSGDSACQQTALASASVMGNPPRLEARKFDEFIVITPGSETNSSTEFSRPHGRKTNGSSNSSSTATPQTTPSPSPSPTPFLQVRKRDEIRVYYPERFLKDTEGEVRFELEQVAREVLAATTTTNANVEVRSAPAAVPGVAIGTPLAKAFEGYDAYATVRLIPNGLVITSQPQVTEQLLSDKLAKWVWRLKPEDNVGEKASFRFEFIVVWRAKGKPDKSFPDRWPHEPFEVGIGPPLTVKAAVYGAPVSLGGGVVALGLGALQRRRRRLTGEEEIEEDIAATVPAPVEEPEEEVSSTVYAPTEATPGDSFLVQVFVHLPEQVAGLDEIAKEADDAARMRISNKLKKKIKRGTELAFHLTMPSLEIDEPVQSCVWNGEPVWTQFGVTVPQDRKPGNIIGTVIVSEASVPIGHLKFKFKIAGSTPQEESAPVGQTVAAGNMTRYKQAFISYASKDRAEVLKRVQMLNLVKVKYFQDLLTLEPGDDWEKLIYQYIDESDVFYLFWSRAASESKWVKKEIVYAIKRKGGNEESAPAIVPVIIEGPPAIKPPEELSFLHFNDKFMYFISAEEIDN